MNVTVFAVRQVAVFEAVFLTPVYGITVNFLQGGKCLSLVWFHHHMKWPMLCVYVWFTSTVYGEVFFIL